MVTENGLKEVKEEKEVEQEEPDDEFAFSPAVQRAWEGIEVGARKTHLEELKTQRQDSLVKAMSNVRTGRLMLEYKENDLEDHAAQLTSAERQVREAGIIRARLELDNALQECDALAEELETLDDAIKELNSAGSAPMIGGNRATRRRG